MSLRDYIVRAVEEKGADYVYPDSERDNALTGEGLGQCRYFTAMGRPSCIFGHVLSYLGHSAATEGVPAELVLPKDMFSPRELRAATRAQVEQDQGATWGDVLATYDGKRVN